MCINARKKKEKFGRIIIFVKTFGCFLKVILRMDVYLHEKKKKSLEQLLFLSKHSVAFRAERVSSICWSFEYAK